MCPWPVSRSVVDRCGVLKFASSPVELVGRIPKNGGSKPTAILVGWWVFVFPPKYTGDLLVQVGIPEGFWPKSRGLRGPKMVGKCWVLVE